ncbi:sugar ABC transporter ATP-binding protein [Mesorhizobium sp. ASY16-5R]|uniref:sugar ABC transporter ATP-binding protein n=1 Tax=Mesorhizobium sp. ASY16-5R TaxID=3445772 RepID=UPI003FA0C24D
MSDVVEIRGLRKSYGTNEVLKGVDLDFRSGEIHAFLGANGAGKSTLLGCLSGAVTPGSGTITIGGRINKALTPHQSSEQGVAIIYQHFQVIEGLTVADNIFLGSELLSWGRVRAAEQNRIASELLERLGVRLDPRAMIETLSVGERQLVEIARTLHLKPSVLILDEPTAALSSRETEALHRVVRHLAKSENLAIIYVTHLIDEIAMIADRVSILRDGRVIWSRPVAEASHAEITAAIAPNMARGHARASNARLDALPVLELEGYRSDYTGPVDLSLRPGEVVGLYGLLGSGRTDLLEGLVGARRHRGGKLRLSGKDTHLSGPRHAKAAGVALVASDRKEQSLFGTLGALENVLMPHFGGFAGGSRRQAQLFDDIATRMQLHPHLPRQAGELFSGGNAQKLMMGRWLFPELGIRVLLLDEPTQGVDVGARAELYRLLQDFTAAGGAILVASSAPDEIAALCDRVLILAKGRQAFEMDKDITEERLVECAHHYSHTLESEQARASLTTIQG